MNHELDIARKLKESMRTSCDDAHYFSDNEANLVNAEYLLTVNAAKAIKELNTYFGDPYKIRLEDSICDFVTSCTPPLARDPNSGSGFPRCVRRTNITKVQSGRIDIGVYTDQVGFDVPVCAIEVKGFNPPQNKIVRDLERNSEYFWVKSTTGSSTLPLAFFIAVHSFKGVFSDEKEIKNLRKIEKRYRGYIDGHRELSRLDHKIDPFTIRRGTVPDVDDVFVREHGLQGDEDYHFVGVVVTTKRKPQN